MGTAGSFDEAPFLSVVIPAYREEKRLPATLEALPRELAAAGIASYEAVVVDDGSPDGTSEVARRAAEANPRIRVLRHDANFGKGRAVRTGALAARGEWVLVTDADASTPASDVARLLAVGRRGVPVVVGSRRVKGAEIGVRQPLHREALGFAFAALRRLLVLPTVRDTQCGFKLFRADAARALFEAAREDGFVYDVEVLLLARQRGWQVVEVPVRWSDDPRTQVRALPASASMALGLLRLALRRVAPAPSRADRPRVRRAP